MMIGYSLESSFPKTQVSICDIVLRMNNLNHGYYIGHPVGEL